MATVAPPLTFTVPGDAVPAPRPRIVHGARGGLGVVPNKNYEAFKGQVGWAARLAWRKRLPTKGDVHLSIVFYRSTMRRTDLDNLAKGVLDGMTGIVYEDDTQVSRMYLERNLDKDEPRTVVDIQGPVDG